MENRKKQFSESMQRFGDYFDIKITPQITKAYYDQLYYIGQHAFIKLVSQIIADRKPFKSQFPSISEFGPLYESSDDKKPIVEFVEQDCDECKKLGLIYYKYWHFGLGIVYATFTACPKCNNWKKHFNTLDAHHVYSGKSRICTHNKIPRMDKEQICMMSGVLEVSDDGVFRMSREQLTDRVLEFYGERKVG